MGTEPLVNTFNVDLGVADITVSGVSRALGTGKDFQEASLACLRPQCFQSPAVAPPYPAGAMSYTVAYVWCNITGQDSENGP